MAKEAKEVKTMEQRIDRIYKLAMEHFGEVRFVGIKKHSKNLWVAKIQFDEFGSLITEDKDAIGAIKKLRNRLNKIVDRYSMV